MEYVALGKTNLMVSRTSFGTGGVEDLDDEEALSIINKGYEKGINFFDLASVSLQSPLRYTFIDKRDSVILGVQTSAKNANELLEEVENFFTVFKTDYIDLLHLHHLAFVPVKNDSSGLIACLERLKEEGKIKYYGFSTESLSLAEEAIESGLYATLRFPFNYVSNAQEIDLLRLCKEAELGFIAYKPLLGGKIQNIPLAFGFLRQYETAVPVWGFRSEDELQQIIYFEEHPPQVDSQFLQDIEQEKALFFGV